MSFGFVTFACQVALAWTAAYTLGLSRDARLRRREEMRSELFEDASERSEDWSAPLAILALTVRGIPSDLTWRADQGLLRRTASDESAERSMGAMQVVQRSSSLFSIAIAISAIAGAVTLMVIDNVQYSRQDDFIAPEGLVTALELVLLAGGLAAASTGFVIMRRRPTLGAVLAVGGSMTVGILVFWLVVPLFVATGVSAYAIHRARRLSTQDNSVSKL